MTSKLKSRAVTAVARLETGEQRAHRVADLITECFPAEGVAVNLADAGGGRWQVAVHFSAAVEKSALRAAVAEAAGAKSARALRFHRLRATDWVGESLAGLAPVVAGRFIIHGAHDRARIPGNRIGIEIEAALAFGTGHHGTTRGCLLALDRFRKSASKSRYKQTSPSPCKGEGRGGGHLTRPLATPTRLAFARIPPPVRGRDLKRKPRILDLGTGSGVLAIAAARSLHARVLATDIDADAVGVARANARLNQAAPLIEFVNAGGVTAHSVRWRAPFDLAFANILLGPLLRMAAPLRRLIAPGGHLVLSGLLAAQANAAIAAYRPLALERRIDLDGWTTLVFVRPRASRRTRRVPLPLVGRG